MNARSFIPTTVALLALGCSDLPTVAFEASDQPALTATASPLPGVTAEAGTLGPGSLYQILVPDAWNGMLVLYAHGYYEGDDVRLPDVTNPLDSEGALLFALTQLGFATAFSSFSENGLAVKDGAQRTKQLRGIFVSKFGQPNRSIMIGASLGGTIAVKLIEQFPEHYAGSLALCGFVGGSRAELDYMANVRVLFDVFYPGIPGDLYNLPPVALRPAVLAGALLALNTDDSGAKAMQTIMAGLGTPIPGGDTPHPVFGTERNQSVMTALAFNMNRFEDVLSRTRGHSFFDNMGTDYGNPLVNGLVSRFTATLDALNYLNQYYQPSGNLQVPLVTLHTTEDPAVPMFHEALYAQSVAAAGSSSFLDQLFVPRYGHCTFTALETVGALNLLLTRIH